VSRIEFDKETRDLLSRLLKRRLKDRLDVDIDPFDALDLLDFLSETLGPRFYNQGLHDAQAIVRDRVETIIEDIYVIEKPVKR
jgi:uncharacterized protein (DUF2164 family)